MIDGHKAYPNEAKQPKHNDIEGIRTELYQIYYASTNLNDPELINKSIQLEKLLLMHYKNQLKSNNNE
jgi:hypothetical protein